MHETDPYAAQGIGYETSRPATPPSQRRPSLDDPRLISAVDESLSILESFDASEPAQILLLIPCMLVGVACFDYERRERVRSAIRSVRAYTGLKNSDCIETILDEVWKHMDAGDWVSAWDWQAVASRIGVDTPCT